MPYFTPEDLDVDPWEFIQSCSQKEIKEVLEALADEGHLPQSVLLTNSSTLPSLNEEMFREALDKINQNYVRLSNEEEELIMKIANRL